MSNREHEGTDGWRAGIEASLREITRLQANPRDMYHKAYFAALDELEIRLRATLSRGSEHAASPIAAWPRVMLAEKFTVEKLTDSDIQTVYREIPALVRSDIRRACLIALNIKSSRAEIAEARKAIVAFLNGEQASSPKR